MTDSKPMVSIRLDPELARRLDEFCTETGVTRSYVVQESIAEYLVSQTGPTLGTLADAVLPPAGGEALDLNQASPRPPRQRRFRAYARDKREQRAKRRR